MLRCHLALSPCDAIPGGITPRVPQRDPSGGISCPLGASGAGAPRWDSEGDRAMGAEDNMRHFFPILLHQGEVFGVLEPLQGLGKGKTGALPALPPTWQDQPCFLLSLPWGPCPWSQLLGTSPVPTSLGASSCPGSLQPSLGTSPASSQPTATNRKLQFVLLMEHLGVTKAVFKLLGKPQEMQGLPLSITYLAQGLPSASPSRSLPDVPSLWSH